MLTPRKPIDNAATHAKLDALAATVQREAEHAEPDLFDDALLSATFSLVELCKLHADALGQMQARVNRLARRL